jgi:acetyl esterase/lipase
MRLARIIPWIVMLAGCQAASTPPTLVDSPREPVTYTCHEVGRRALSAYAFSPAMHGARRQSSAILLFHGGGWSAGAPEWTFEAARRFAALGMVAIPIEYRLSQGDLTPIEALADGCAAFRWARGHAGDLGFDPERVAGYGVSAGGRLVAGAAMVGRRPEDSHGTRSGPDALLLWSPALDLSRDGWFHKKLLGRASAADYSPVEHVTSSTPPTSIVQGAQDSLTPRSGAKRYCDELVRAGGVCELNVHKGVGHLPSRNLANQETGFDPDLEARAKGIAQHERFRIGPGYL